ncbi:AAA family ATPase [Robbsia andropogonis]|uniref:AAA family ATPase n=1 Tax=Robbsia andropogonis TaxID=28092 RepID=UPI003D1FAEEE
MNWPLSVKTASKLQKMLEDWDTGEVDITAMLRQINDEHETWLMRRKVHPLVNDRIEDILAEDENDTGFHWRLDCLNRSMRPLRGGDFGIVAARVDSGKSTALASELTFMAPQVDVLYPGQNRTIIVFNNEGPGKRLKHRCYNAALQMNTTGLVELSQNGTIFEKYVEALGGRNVIKVLNVHDYTMPELEDIVKDLNPAIVVIDMLDNVTLGKAAGNGGD